MLMINRENSWDLGTESIRYWTESTLFYEKEHFLWKNPPTYSIHFLKVLYQNKALYNFPKRGQHLIVKRNIGPEYALSMVWKILTSLFNKFYKPTQNVQNKIYKTSKIGQDKKS